RAKASGKAGSAFTSFTGFGTVPLSTGTAQAETAEVDTGDGEEEEPKKNAFTGFSFGTSFGSATNTSTSAFPTSGTGFGFSSTQTQNEESVFGSKPKDVVSSSQPISFGTTTAGFTFGSTTKETTPPVVESKPASTSIESKVTFAPFVPPALDEAKSSITAASSLFQNPPSMTVQPFQPPKELATLGSKPTAVAPKEAGEGSDHHQYLLHRLGLNTSFKKALLAYLDEDPYVNLSFSFDVYRQHWESVEKQYGGPKARKSDSIATTAPTLVPKPTSTLALDTNQSVAKEEKASTSTTFGVFDSPASPVQTKDSSIPPNPFSFASSTTAGADTDVTKPNVGFTFGGTGFGTGPSVFGTQSTESSQPATSGFFGSTQFGSTKPTVGFGASFTANPPSSTFASEPIAPQNEENQTQSATEPAADETKATEEDVNEGETEEGNTSTGEECRVGEEDEDTLYRTLCKVFTFNKEKKGFVDLGVGHFRVNKHRDTHSVRLLCRQKHTNKITLNVAVFASMKFNYAPGKRDLSFIAVGPDQTPVKYALRVKTPTIAQEMLTALEEARDEVANQANGP
ncbi:Protein CBR-NPP-9, partial [Dispira simplex]